MRMTPSLQSAAAVRDHSGPAVIFADPSARATETHTWYVYVDNMGILGTCRASVAAALGEAVCIFQEVGLLTHEEELFSGEGKVLGSTLDGEKLQTCLTRKRFWRVYQAVHFALNCKKLPGRIWEVLVGHLTFCGLMRRELLCCLTTIYAWMAKHYYEAAPMWPSAREEITAFVNGLFLAQSDWTMPWSSHVGASDASLNGVGVCTSVWTEKAVRDAGRIQERGRFTKKMWPVCAGFLFCSERIR